MSQGPKDGKYVIIPTVSDPTPPIGATPQNDPAIPVIVDGMENMWTVQRDGRYGLYTLTLNFDGAWLSTGMEDKVVVERKLLGAQWVIQIHPGDVYTIAMPGDNPVTKAWTVDSCETGTQVTLTEYVDISMKPEQLFKFVPILE